MRLQLLQANELESRRVGRFQIDRGCDVVLLRVFPARDANAPFVARLESWKSPFRMRRDQVVPIQYGKIEELPGGQDTDRMQSNILWPGTTIAVAVKAG